MEKDFILTKDLSEICRNPAYLPCDIDKIELFKKYICEAGYSIKNIIIWVKDNWTAGDLKAQFGQQYECIVYANKGRAEIKGKRYSDIWSFARVPLNEQIHQNQKLISLLCRAIAAHSSEGEIVFDGCIGSGSTCIAARKLGRKYLGFEIDVQKFAAAQRRIDTVFKQINFLYQ